MKFAVLEDQPALRICFDGDEIAMSKTFKLMMQVFSGQAAGKAQSVHTIEAADPNQLELLRQELALEKVNQDPEEHYGTFANSYNSAQLESTRFALN